MFKPKNKFLRRDPRNIQELMEKMAGDFPDYSYYGFLDKFTKGNPKLKQELIKEGYFVSIGKNQKGEDHYILGKTGIQWVFALRTLQYSKAIRFLTFVIATAAVISLII